MTRATPTLTEIWVLRGDAWVFDRAVAPDAARAALKRSELPAVAAQGSVVLASTGAVTRHQLGAARTAVARGRAVERPAPTPEAEAEDDEADEADDEADEAEPKARGAPCAELGCDAERASSRANTPSTIADFCRRHRKEALDLSRDYALSLDEAAAALRTLDGARAHLRAARAKTRAEASAVAARTGAAASRATRGAVRRATAATAEAPPAPRHTVAPPAPRHTVTPPAPRHTVTPPAPRHTVTPPVPAPDVLALAARALRAVSDVADRVARALDRAAGAP